MNCVFSAIACLARLALPMSILVSAAGCAESFGGASPGYDQQACAERALRRGPDPLIVAQAIRAFKMDCHEGGAEACSALGVMNEMGIGVPKNAAQAVALYTRSCQAGNRRGCANLGVAKAQGVGMPRDAMGASWLLSQACDQGDAGGCAYLGRLYAVGDGVVRDADRAAQLFEVACRGQEGSACTALGDLRASTSRGAADEYYGMACALGDKNGCRDFEAVRPAARVLFASDAR